MSIPGITPALAQGAQKALSPAAQTAYNAATRHLGKSATNAIAGGTTYLSWSYLLPLLVDPTPLSGTIQTILTGYYGIRSGKHLFNGLGKYFSYRNLR